MVRILNLIFILFIKLLPKSFVSVFASQYVAGENTDDVLDTVSKLNNKGFKVTIDILGEHFTEKTEIAKIVSEYKYLYEQIHQRKLDSNISIKPTHIGLDVSYNLALDNFKEILNTASIYDNFVRIDMESSNVTSNTISIYKDIFDDSKNIGLVLQSYLHRSYDDLKKINNKELNFRLCKGIYNESENISFKKYQDINNNYLKMLDYAFKNNIYVGIATHDKNLLDKCFKLIKKNNVNPSRFEFQVLYGVPMDDYLQKNKSNNYTTRIYVPYGKQWYEYSIRRIKENPNILKYVIKNLFN